VNEYCYVEQESLVVFSESR